MAGALVLALDVGTSSLRTALFDQRGRLLATTRAQRAYRLREREPGMAELAPEVLLEAARRALDETLSRHASSPRLRSRPIAAVGASCFWHSLVGVDPKGRPLTPIYTWADSRCAGDAARLRAAFDERAAHAATGCMLRASYWPAKLAWLRRTRARLARSVSQWISPGEWLYWRLAGIRACPPGMATGTGLYDPSRLDWDDGLLALCGVSRERLPALAYGAFPMSPRLAHALPSLADALWTPPIGDGAAGNLGSGATVPGTAAINYGTSAAVRILRRGRRARAPYGLFAYRVDAARYLVGGAVSNAGNLRAWCERELRLPDDPLALERALARRRAPDHGLTVLPFFHAERAPSWREDMTGCVQGLRSTTTALDIAQAITEATFHRLADITARVPRSGATRFIVSGGLARSTPGLRRLADVLGQAVWPCREAEASLRGAALRGLEALGLEPPPAPLGKVVEPDAEIARRHRADRKRLRQLERTLHG